MRYLPGILSCILALVALFIIATPTAQAGSMTVEFSWEYSEGGPQRDHSFELVVEKDYLNGYRSYSANERFDYDTMITTTDPFVMNAALELRAIALEYGYEEPALALSFVQSMEYRPDEETTGYLDFARFPLETLVDQVSDCEDTSLLYTTLMIDLGYESVLFVIHGEPSGHMASGISAHGLTGDYLTYNGTQFFYAETTSDTYRIGQVPSDIDMDDIEVIEKGRSKTPYGSTETKDEAQDVQPLYYILMGALLAGAISLIGTAIASSRRRKAEAATVMGQDTWEQYERMGQDMEPPQTAYGHQYAGAQPPPYSDTDQPPAPPPEQWGYEDRAWDTRDHQQAQTGGNPNDRPRRYDPYQ
jgi:hypothetical protein